MSTMYQNRDGEWVEVAVGGDNSHIPIASSDEVGLVKPDNDTLNVAADGTLSVDTDKVSSNRHLGEIFYSLLPINSSKVHLLDGSVIHLNGLYSELGSYIDTLYDSLERTLNVSIQGSPTNTDNVFSGFSSANYCELNEAFNPGSNRWNVTLKVVTGDDVTTTQAIICPETSNPYSGLYLGIANGRLTVGLGNDSASTGYNVIANSGNPFSSNITLSVNTEYTINVEFDSTQYIVVVTNGENVQNQVAATSSVMGTHTKRFGVNNDGNNPFLGSISFKDAFFYINDEVVWEGVSEAGGFFCSESEWQQDIANYGVCGKFVYNRSEGTLRLPKVTGFMEGTLDRNTVGVLTEAGLPNITGTIESYTSDTQALNTGVLNVGTGAFSAATRQSTHSIDPVDSVSTYTYKQEFDASRSSSIYGNSLTVQPQSIKGFLYIVLANGVTTPVSIQIDNVVQDITRLDEEKVNAAQAISATMPDYSSRISIAGLSDSASWQENVYTLPADGYLQVFTTVSATTQGTALGIRVNEYVVSYDYDANNQAAHYNKLIPVSAGDKISIYFHSDSQVGGETATMAFYYANGNKPE